jgi:hypothetical protein
MKHVCVLAVALALLVAAVTPCVAYAREGAFAAGTKPSTIALRLHSAKHIGLSIDERIGGFTIRVYTPEQQKKNIVSLKKYRAARGAFNARIASIDERLRKAMRQQGQQAVHEAQAITNERDRALSDRPSSSFAGRVALHQVVQFGTDYMEIESWEESDTTVLIPFDKICRVIFAKTERKDLESAGSTK